MKRKVIIASLFLLFGASCSDAPTPQADKLGDVVLAAPVAEEAAKGKVLKLEKVVDQNKIFDNFKQNHLNKTWELNPSFAVYVGFYDYDDMLAVPNGEHRALRRQYYATELQALKRFDANQLSSSNGIDLAIIESQLRSQLWYIDVFRAYEWNPAEYNPAGAFGVILNTDYKPLTERLTAISTRLIAVPAYYQAAINNLKVPTLEHLGLAIQQSAGALKMFEKLIPEKIQEVELDAPLSAQLASGLLDASTAVKSYIEWLEAKQAELLESGKARDFRIGEELYEKKFKFDIESNYTGKELYNLALDAKQKLHTEMVSITEELWSKYFEDQVMPEIKLEAVKKMIDHLSQKHVERDKFVDEIRRQMPIIQKYMDDNKLLDSDSSRPLVVRLTPEYQRGFAGASVNAPGPYDATANTYYNVSPLDDYTDEQAESYLREYNHWILQILNIHEAIPGHYTQLMHANKSPSKIKSIFGNGAMVEGWAVYSERMMLESGYGDNEPEMWLMYSKWNLRVVVNTILDYSIQVLGMQREAALDLLMNEAFQERTEAEGKWRRATVSQVQLTSYFSGYSEIYAFREELKQTMGESFDLRTFHNKFLSYGNAPVPVIRSSMLAELALASQSRIKAKVIEPDSSL
ncbi:MAG: hypothetical protein ACI854_002460 [Arenicella sp.]